MAQFKGIEVKVETVGFETATEQIRKLKDELLLIEIVAKRLGLRKRDIRKLIKVKIRKELQE